MTNTAHYPGRVDVDPTAYFGADKFGAFYRADSATYSPEADRTTVQFVPIPPGDLPAFADDHIRQTQDKARIIELFGGRW